MAKSWMALVVFAAAIDMWAAVPVSGQEKAPEPAPIDRLLGKSGAPITIFEYASFTCPHCAQFDIDILPKLRERWIDTGKVRLIFRDYPLDGAALKAAMLGRCAPPERFYDFVDVLFQSQERWAGAVNIDAALGAVAEGAGISINTANSCMKNDTLMRGIAEEELRARNDYGIDWTPTFFINGAKFEGYYSYDEFESILKQFTTNSRDSAR